MKNLLLAIVALLLFPVLANAGVIHTIVNGVTSHPLTFAFIFLFLALILFVRFFPGPFISGLIFLCLKFPRFAFKIITRFFADTGFLKWNSGTKEGKQYPDYVLGANAPASSVPSMNAHESVQGVGRYPIDPELEKAIQDEKLGKIEPATAGT